VKLPLTAPQPLTHPFWPPEAGATGVPVTSYGRLQLGVRGLQVTGPSLPVLRAKSGCSTSPLPAENAPVPNPLDPSHPELLVSVVQKQNRQLILPRSEYTLEWARGQAFLPLQFRVVDCLMMKSGGNSADGVICPRRVCYDCDDFGRMSCLLFVFALLTPTANHMDGMGGDEERWRPLGAH
jgi:hypothetical protein